MSIRQRATRTEISAALKSAPRCPQCYANNPKWTAAATNSHWWILGAYFKCTRDGCGHEFAESEAHRYRPGR
jgi:hypothetical protein